MFAFAPSLREPDVDGVAGVTGGAAATACSDSTGTSPSGVDRLASGASAGVDVATITVSSSCCAGLLVRFELLVAFLDCFGFFVIVFPPRNSQKCACREIYWEFFE